MMLWSRLIHPERAANLHVKHQLDETEFMSVDASLKII